MALLAQIKKYKTRTMGSEGVSITYVASQRSHAYLTWYTHKVARQ
jgi:hypothetical protein